MRVYNTYKSTGSYIWLISVTSILLAGYIYILADGQFSTKTGLELVILFGIVATVWYINFIYPKFIIDRENLIVKKIFSNKTIDISNIQRIETNYKIFKATRILFVPYKVSMRVVYNKFDEVYINPNDQEEFFRHLHSIRPNIVIK